LTGTWTAFPCRRQQQEAIISEPSRLPSSSESAPLRRSVFVSYARADRPQVQRLIEALTGTGIEVWWDGLIEGGEAFARTIEERLGSVDVVLAVWTATSIMSDWVRDEAAHGRDRHRFVAVTLDGSMPPLGFRQYHSVDLSGWKSQPTAPEFAAVLRAINHSAQDQSITAGGVTQSAGRQRQVAISRRAALAGGGVLVAAAAGLTFWRRWADQPPANSIAVLPFRNLSGDPQQGYFSDGLAEEIRSRLANQPQIFVAAPTSSNLFRAAAEDARVIAKKLGVAWLLQGTVRRAGDFVRVTASLIDGNGGLTSWSQTFDRGLQDIFTVEGEVAGIVADALTGKISGSGKSPLQLGVGGTKNVAAFDFYLHAKALYDLDTDGDTYRQAASLVERALAIDANFARAYVLQSRILMAIRNGYASSTGEMATLYDRALQAVRKALLSEPNLPVAHTVLAYTLLADSFNFRAAIPEYERGRALGPGDADIAVSYANFMFKAGRNAEASKAIAFAEARDPLNPIVYRIHGMIDLFGGRPDAAMKQFAHALSLNPKLALVHSYIGDIHLAAGQVAEAQTEYEQEPKESFRLSGLAIASHRQGDEVASRKAFNQMVQSLGDTSMYQQAQLLAQRGAIEAALKALERAYTLKDSGLLLILGDFKLNPLRGRPEFKRLLGRMGLSQTVGR
jgi:TolB-like protein/tetratricopeptide (TPR) repeat protein